MDESLHDAYSEGDEVISTGGLEITREFSQGNNIELRATIIGGDYYRINLCAKNVKLIIEFLHFIINRFEFFQVYVSIMCECVMFVSSRWESGHFFTDTQLYPWVINTLFSNSPYSINF